MFRQQMWCLFLTVLATVACSAAPLQMPAYQVSATNAAPLAGLTFNTAQDWFNWIGANWPTNIDRTVQYGTAAGVTWAQTSAVAHADGLAITTLASANTYAFTNALALYNTAVAVAGTNSAAQAYTAQTTAQASATAALNLLGGSYAAHTNGVAEHPAFCTSGYGLPGQVISAGNWGVLTNVVSSGRGGTTAAQTCWNAANDTFTATHSGWYLVSGGARALGGATDTYSCGVYVAGVEPDYAHLLVVDRVGSATEAPQGTVATYVGAGQAVRIGVQAIIGAVTCNFVNVSITLIGR